MLFAADNNLHFSGNYGNPVLVVDGQYLAEVRFHGQSSGFERLQAVRSCTGSL